MSVVTTDAIILQAFPYGDTSRILRLITRDYGVRSVIAKGATRPKSRFSGLLEVFTEGSATIYATVINDGGAAVGETTVHIFDVTDGGSTPIGDPLQVSQFLNAPVAFALTVIGQDWASYLVSAGAVAGTFRRENLLSSLAVFVAYALGMTLVLLALTVSMGMARQSMVRWLRRALP